MSKTKVAVVVLNWNGEMYLRRFLPSVTKNLPDYARLFVADNGSTDSSLSFLSDKYPEVPVISLGSNFGFAGGYNKALRSIEAEYYVLLNSDVEVTRHWIEPVVEYMDINALVAAAQPKILSFSERQKFEYAGASGGFIDILGFPFCRGRIFDNIEPDHGQYDNIIEVIWATGACMFVRAAAFREAGGFDERFFAHMEEIDLCLRLHRIGYSIAAVPSSVVFHLGGGTLASSNPKKTFFNFRNSLWLMAKNWPARYFYPLLPLRLVLDIIAALKFLFSGNAYGALAIFRAHLAFLAGFIAMRRIAPSCSDRLPEGILMGSIVLNFYLKGKKLFSHQKKYKKISGLST